MADDGKLVFVMIIALIAFGIGAVAGITIGMGNIDGVNNTTDVVHVENVTKEMTTNLTEDEEPIYNPDIDDVDYNSNKTYYN